MSESVPSCKSPGLFNPTADTAKKHPILLVSSGERRGDEYALLQKICYGLPPVSGGVLHLVEIFDDDLGLFVDYSDCIDQVRQFESLLLPVVVSVVELLFEFRVSPTLEQRRHHMIIMI